MEKQKKTISRVPFLIALIIVLGFPFAFFFYFRMKKHPEILPEKVLPIYGKKSPITNYVNGKKQVDTIYQILPKFSFTDHLNRPFTNKDMNGKVFVVNYFFSTCPTICVDMVKNLKKVQDEFILDSDIRILSLTVDPETDSVGTLYRYAQDHEINSDKWLLLTGNKADLYNLARTGFLITATVGDGGPNDFIHSEKLVLVDKEGRLRGFYDGTSDEEIEQLKEDIKKLLVAYIVPRR